MTRSKTQKTKSKTDIQHLLTTQLTEKEFEQNTLLCLAGKIAAARTREDLLDIVNHDILDLFGGTHYTLCLLADNGETHYPFLYSNDSRFDKEISENPIQNKQHPVEDGVFNQALKADAPVLLSIRTLLKNEKVPAYIKYWAQTGIEEILLTKIKNGNENKGVLYLYANKNNSFSSEKFRFMEGIADLLGTGICNVLANEKIEHQMAEINLYKQRLEEENSYLLEEQKATYSFKNLIGSSEEIQKVFHLIAQVAQSDATILLLGETGTGKELIARAIHDSSSRENKLMIKVNCAAMPANLIESELFGHEKGSFTGATDRRIGKFELANNSTLFLDEIGELPSELQVKLLRAIQEKEIERIGGKTTFKVNVRIIAATNRNLEKEVAQGRFRSDLYYRLNVFPITLPPLRKRKEDIPALVSYFIDRFARNAGKQIQTISHKAMTKLMSYSWPGNIRELEHLIERTVLLTNGKIIKEVQLPQKGNIAELVGNTTFQVRSLDEIEREYIIKVLKLSNGKVSGPFGAASKLKLPSTTLISKMQRLGIRKEHFAPGKEEVD